MTRIGWLLLLLAGCSTTGNSAGGVVGGITAGSALKKADVHCAKFSKVAELGGTTSGTLSNGEWTFRCVAK